MKKFFFRLKILAIFCLAILAFFPGKLQAQNFETDISISPEVKRLNEIESDLNERLAKLLQNLQTIANFTKKGQYTQARRQLLEVKKNIDQAQRNLAEQKSLGALEKFLYQIEGDLRKSNRALMKSNKDEALTHLTQAYRRTQALEDAGRPVLKFLRLN
jgi:hypothetical protein